MEAAAAAAASSSPAPCSPHLKKVLKTYQLSAVKSLHGPSTVLASAAAAAATVGDDDDDEDDDRHRRRGDEEAASTSSSDAGGFRAPPPLPIQQPPLLTAPDQSCSERSETVLEGETIACFAVGGEKRLCLPQVLNSVLRDFSLQQINQVCDELLIFCSRCTQDQLTELKESGVLPATAPSCGLITKTDAERLCSALLHRAGLPPPPCMPDLPSIKVYHECFGKCSGICTPELYARGNAYCIECAECHGMFSPQHFVCHAHRALENRTCHWGFDSSNWTRYLHAAEDQAEHERLSKLLDAFKEQASSGPPPQPPPATLKRKQFKPTSATEYGFDPVLAASGRLGKRHKPFWYEPLHHYKYKEAPALDACKEPSEAALKRVRLEPADCGAATAAAAPAVYAVYPEQLLWCDAWGPRIAFRPWPLPLAATAKHKAAALADSLPPVPAYLSHSPPVLLHPERVVPLSDSERFERSFQPNVALAPVVRPRHDDSKPDVKMEAVSDELHEKQSAIIVQPNPVPGHNLQLHYNPEIELSTDTDDSLSDAASLARANKDCVAEALEAVSDDLTEDQRSRVARVVGRMAESMERLRSHNRLLEKENGLLKQIRILQRHSTPAEGQDGPTEEISKLENELAEVGSKILRLGFRPQKIQTGGGSPVSVITSPPLLIKSEPQTSD
ncbi:ski oncogene isoform X2 [Schistocerca piceifrons]|uniref:ski oncogene isoform X2 n=1 Tax=Schistocerca piceifrons TaxID=274613 RepID=UPI001F5FBC69|nr:ski oncogene isoform X2 [Schistocerca piceifrons]